MTAAQDTTTPHQQPAPTGLRRLTSAYRRMYCRLPPGVQLVGLQLWLPLVFIVLFCLCYIEAFHAPSVHHAPVGVVAPADSPTVAALRHATGQTFDYRPYGSVEAARHAVRDGVVIGALAHPGGPDPTLYVASAHQYQAKTIVTNTLRPVYAAIHQQLAVTDLAPLPRHDSFGMTTMYLMLAWCIGGYTVAMFIGLMGAPLLQRTRVAIIVGGAVVVSLLANLLAGPVIGAVQGHFWQLVAIAVGWIIAIGLTVNGLSYFFGRFIALPAITIFVFLSVPSSGAAYPTWMLPRVFGDLQPYVVGFGMTEMIKRTLYGVGEPYSRGIREMACYAVAGLILMAVGKPWHERREVRRILAGRTTMFVDAQAANREHTHAIRERVLARYGVGSESAESTQEEDELAGDALSNYGRPLSPCEQEPSAPAPRPDGRARPADATPPEVSRPAPDRADRRAGPAR